MSRGEWGRAGGRDRLQPHPLSPSPHLIICFLIIAARATLGALATSAAPATSATATTPTVAATAAAFTTCRRIQSDYVLRLEPFRLLDYVELDSFALIESAESTRLNLTVVNKYVGSPVLLNETVPLFLREPLNLPGASCHGSPDLNDGMCRGAPC